tara:strand:+ start:5537 stop:6202 length:666 start_codon:yes stop_codon:yes gene_type:complete
MTWETYTAAFQRTFPKGSRIEQVRGGVDLVLTCAEGHEEVEHFNKRMPPDKAKVHLQNKGWRFWGKKTRCPTHNEKQQSEEKQVVEVPSEVAAVVTQSSTDAKAAKRQAFLWLDEVFDEDHGRYKPGHSDETVAKETGLSERAVAELREEFGFEIKEPPEFREWHQRVNQIETNIKAVEVGMNERIEQIRVDGADTIKALLQQTADLRTKVEQTIKKAGWE